MPSISLFFPFCVCYSVNSCPGVPDEVFGGGCLVVGDLQGEACVWLGFGPSALLCSPAMGAYTRALFCLLHPLSLLFPPLLSALLLSTSWLLFLVLKVIFQCCCCLWDTVTARRFWLMPGYFPVSVRWRPSNEEAMRERCGPLSAPAGSPSALPFPFCVCIFAHTGIFA